MSKSLADIRNSEHVGRPERVYPICVAGRLAAEVGRLDRELEAVANREEATNKRLGAKSEAVKLAEKIDALRDQMTEHTVELRLRAVDPGAWRRWCREHPPREDEDRDGLYKVSICNSDDLIADLATFVVKVGDEEPKDGDVAFIVENAAYGDLLGVARVVMAMHETAVDATPFSRVDWLKRRRSERDSE